MHRLVQDLEAVAEENAILMRECAMASLAALESVDAEDSPVTPHPEMLDDLPTRIPDTASEFLATVNESALERYQRERSRDGAEALADIDDAVRPGAHATPALSPSRRHTKRSAKGGVE